MRIMPRARGDLHKIPCDISPRLTRYIQPLHIYKLQRSRYTRDQTLSRLRVRSIEIIQNPYRYVSRYPPIHRRRSHPLRNIACSRAVLFAARPKILFRLDRFTIHSRSRHHTSRRCNEHRNFSGASKYFIQTERT